MRKRKGEDNQNLLLPIFFTEASRGSLMELLTSPICDRESLSLARLLLRVDNGQLSEASPPTRNKRQIVQPQLKRVRRSM